jgi:hypothetical protein
MRKTDVLRIRKALVSPKFFEGEAFKKIIESIRKQVKKSEIEDTAEWFIVWEITEGDDK